MKNEKMEVAVIGALNIDICGAANVSFSSGDSLPGEVRMSLGGAGFNVARHAAALGARCGFFSVLGEDAHASTIRAEARRLGLDLEGCRWDAAENGRHVMVLDSAGGRLAAVNDMAIARRMDAAFVKGAAPRMAEAKVIVADADLQAESLWALSEALGESRLVADAVSPSRCMRLEKILPRIHTLKAGLAEAGKLTGYAGAERCATALLKKGVQRVLLSLGAEGLLAAEGDEMFRLPALTEKTVNDLGAGEAMTAALAVALLREMDLATAAKFAAAAGAIVCQCREAFSPALERLRGIAEPKRK